MVAGWFFEKSGWIGKVEDEKLVLLNKEMDFNRAIILRRRIFTQMNSEIVRFDSSRSDIIWF
jgi:hypothetical protein